MSLRKCEAIVVRRMPFRNSSLIVGMLAPTQGLVEGIAKGARRSRSPLYGRLDYFREGELVYYERRSGTLSVVSQFSPVAEHAELGRTVGGFAAGMLFCEAVNAGCVPESPAPEAYALLQRGLAALEHGAQPAKTASAWGLGLLGALGFAPMLEACVDCGRPLTDNAAGLDAERGGAVCTECARGARVREIDPGVLKALAFLQRQGVQGGQRLGLRARETRAVLATVVDLLEAQLARRLHSGRFLLQVIGRERLTHAA